MPLKKKKPAAKKAKKAIKKPIKKPAKKKILKKKPTVKKIKKVLKKKVVKKPKNVIGIVTHYFPHVRAAVIKLKMPLSVGDTIKINGHTTDFIQTVTSMQVDHVSVTLAKKGAEIGLEVNSRVREHDLVTKA